MPYGTPISDEARIIRHQSIYGGYPPVTRLGINEKMFPQEINDNMNLIALVGGIAGTWIFIEYILPHLIDK